MSVLQKHTAAVRIICATILMDHSIALVSEIYLVLAFFSVLLYGLCMFAAVVFVLCSDLHSLATQFFITSSV